jgi:hypothetical protein
MSQLRHNRVKESYIGKACMAIALLLSLFILVQMLGVPVTLLNPLEAADTQRTSILEGFSVPSSFPQLTSSFETETAPDAQPSVHLPVLASILFSSSVLLLHTIKAPVLYEKSATQAFAILDRQPINGKESANELSNVSTDNPRCRWGILSRSDEGVCWRSRSISRRSGGQLLDRGDLAVRHGNNLDPIADLDRRIYGRTLSEWN